LDSMFNQAFHLYQIKEFDKAITGYRGLLEINPAHQQAHVNIAITMQVMGDVKASLSAYEKALAINPFSQPAREGFASALNQSGFYIDAAVEFHKLLKVHRDNVPAHLGLGVLYAQHLNRPDKAEYYYRRVLELNPQHSEAANIRRWLYNKSQ
jgi:tetratricopeptide (TPR) repeat protein